MPRLSGSSCHAGLRDLQGIPHDLAEVDGLERLVATDPRELPQPPHRLGPVERRALDHLQPLAELRPDTRRRRSWARPRMEASRLLKSWATPAAISPRARSFSVRTS